MADERAPTEPNSISNSPPTAKGDLAGAATTSATKRFKALALKSGATVVGVADAAAFDAYAPPKHRPADLLPGARTVLVVGGAQPRAGDWVATSPWLLSTMGTTERIQGVGRRIAQAIESELGYYALFVPPGTAAGDTPFLSLMLAAELAGHAASPGRSSIASTASCTGAPS
jgi:hypothetical protein